MPRLPSGAMPLDRPAPPPIRFPAHATATDDEGNPIIAAINARRAGSLSRADMVQQLVTHVRKGVFHSCHSSTRSSDTESSFWLNKSLSLRQSSEAEIAGCGRSRPQPGIARLQRRGRWTSRLVSTPMMASHPAICLAGPRQ